MPLDPNDPVLARVISVSNREIERLTASSQKRLLEIYMREREVLMARISNLGTADTFTARHLAVTKKALDDAMARLVKELGAELSSAIAEAAGLSAEQGIREVAELESVFGSTATARSVASLAGVVPHRAILAVDELAQLEAKEIVVTLDAETRAILQRGLLQGRNSRQLVPDLARAVGESMEVKRWQLERTLRTGLNAAASRGHNASYLEARNKYLPDLQRQGHEFLMTPEMAKRASKKAGYRRVNHPFSAYVDGKVADLDQPWRIKSPEFPVMFWRREGDSYVGMHYPCHLYERGRQVPYRQGWEAYLSTTAARTERREDLRARIEAKLAQK